MFKSFLFLLTLFAGIYLFAQDSKKPNDTLPVELIYFFGVDSTEISSVVLFWGTATEVNCYGFDIEKSVDSINFKWIGFVMGNGNSNSPKDYSFKDSIFSSPGSYYYRLNQIDTDGASKHSELIQITHQITDVANANKKENNFSLKQNYPNPFNPLTTICFELAKEEEVSLDVFDCEGKLVLSLLKEKRNEGKHQIQLDGKYLSTGVYFYRLNSGTMSLTKKLLLLK